MALWEQTQNVKFLLLAYVNANTIQRASTTKEIPDNEADRITWPVNVSVTGPSWLARWIYQKSRHGSRNAEYVWSNNVRRLSYHECQKSISRDHYWVPTIVTTLKKTNQSLANKLIALLQSIFPTQDRTRSSELLVDSLPSEPPGSPDYNWIFKTTTTKQKQERTGVHPE